MKRIIAMAAATAAGAAVAAGVFSDGELTRTRPTGWLRTRLETQLSGLSGHPEAMSYPYDT